MNKKTYLLISAAIAIVVLTPLLLVVNQEMWDGVICEMSYLTQDLYFISDIYFSQWIKYHIWLLVNQISLATGIHPRVFLNPISVLAIIGLSREVFVYLRDRHGFDEEICYISSWCVLAFPIWHIFVSSLMFMNILCVYLFMLAVNTWRRNRLLATLIFIPSVQVYSIFGLAVGFAASEFVLTATWKTYKVKMAQVFIFCLALVAGYMTIEMAIDIHQGGDYNTFRLDRLQSFINYGVMAAVTLAITYFIGRNRDERDRETLTRRVLAFLAIAFFAGFAYWMVGRPMRFFAFGSFTARHCILTSIPFALLVAIIADQLKPRIPRKVFIGLAGFLIVALMVLVHQGHSHKVAALVFREMLTESFQKIEEPPSGFVAIHAVDYEPPRHVHQFAVNMSMFKAYGKAAWKANGYWRRGRFWDRKSLEAEYDMSPIMLKRHIAGDVTGDAYSRYDFHLDGYHQEGRFWYWWYYLTSDYSSFRPRLELVEQTR